MGIWVGFYFVYDYCFLVEEIEIVSPRSKLFIFYYVEISLRRYSQPITGSLQIQFLCFQSTKIFEWLKQIGIGPVAKGGAISVDQLQSLGGNS